jgi:hypothetical protein
MWGLSATVALYGQLMIVLGWGWGWVSRQGIPRRYHQNEFALKLVLQAHLCRNGCNIPGRHPVAVWNYDTRVLFLSRFPFSLQVLVLFS